MKPAFGFRRLRRSVKAPLVGLALLLTAFALAGPAWATCRQLSNGQMLCDSPAVGWGHEAMQERANRTGEIFRQSFENARQNRIEQRRQDQMDSLIDEVRGLRQQQQESSSRSALERA